MNYFDQLVAWECQRIIKSMSITVSKSIQIVFGFFCQTNSPKPKRYSIYNDIHRTTSTSHLQSWNQQMLDIFSLSIPNHWQIVVMLPCNIVLQQNYDQFPGTQGGAFILLVFPEQQSKTPKRSICHDMKQSIKLLQIAVHTCVHHAFPTCPADHLCSDVLTAYVTSTGRSTGPAHSYYVSLSPDKQQICLRRLACICYCNCRDWQDKSFATCKSAPDKTHWWHTFLLRPWPGHIRTH